MTQWATLALWAPWVPWIVLAVVVMLLLAVVLLLWLALRRPDQRAFEALQLKATEQSAHVEREVRREVLESARGTRQELAGSLSLFQQSLLNQAGDVARTQNEQIDSFRTQLGALQGQMNQSLLRLGENLAEQLRALTEANERRMSDVRLAVEQRLVALQEGNERKLEQMRATVDEKLHATLEQRLGESFKQVAERLEQVHRGLGEMQNLARDVGSLNRVLTNVKSRGTFGEVQLQGLLEQVFTATQYERNVETVPGSGARVEFAIRLPGRNDADGGLWLPIDAKFPREDYERLQQAQDLADAPAAEAAAKAIDTRLRLEARTIKEKYLAAPHTTDFAILFVPTEGLYAEALRRPGLVEAMQREHRVMLAGPTTLLAMLSSLQMGFRTLALEKRSAEVWEVLGAVKTEFTQFGAILAKTRKKLDEASNTISLAERRARVMGRELKHVESLPAQRSRELLPGLDDELPDGVDESPDDG